VVPNTKSVKPKNQCTGMASLHEEKDDHNTTDERKEHGPEDRYSSEPQKAHLTGEFVIVGKFGGHTLCHLASRLANVVRQGGRQTKSLILVILKKSILKLLQLLHSFMYYIWV